MRKRDLDLAIAGLVRAAETASGDIRATAFDLEELAAALSRSQPGRSEALKLLTRRLISIAETLTLEAQVGHPATTRHAVRIALAALAAVATVATGVGEGVGSGLVERLTTNQVRAQSSLTACDTEARNATTVAANPEMWEALRRFVQSSTGVPSENSTPLQMLRILEVTVDVKRRLLDSEFSPEHRARQLAELAEVEDLAKLLQRLIEQEVLSDG